MLPLKCIFVLCFVVLGNSVLYSQEVAKLFTNRDFNAVVKHENDTDLDSIELYEVGFSFFALGNDEKALEFYNRSILAGFGVANVHFAKGVVLRYLKRYKEALSEFDISLKLQPGTLKFLTEKGVTYYQMGEYANAASIYQQAIDMNPTMYDLYPDLMKSLNAGKEYIKAEQVFIQIKTAYTQGELSSGMMRDKRASVAEFTWNDQLVIIYKSLDTPQKSYDVHSYIYLFGKDGAKIQRHFMIEKTDETDTVKFRVGEYEEETQTYSTYAVGWNSDEISVAEIVDAVKQVLDEKTGKCKTYSVGK